MDKQRWEKVKRNSHSHELSTFLKNGLLACLLVLASLPQAHATVTTETRYFGTDICYQNFLSGDASHLTLMTYFKGENPYAYGQSLNATGNNEVQNGIRVWLWDGYNASDATELTSGTPVAVVDRASVGEGFQNATWTLSETNMTRTAYLEVKIYYRRRVATFWQSWIVWNNASYGSTQFYTESFGGTSLPEQTWNVYYYTGFYQAGSFKWFRFYWGYWDGTYDSRIEGVSYDDGVTEEVNTAKYMLIGSIFTAPIMLALALHYKKRRKS